MQQNFHRPGGLLSSAWRIAPLVCWLALMSLPCALVAAQEESAVGTVEREIPLPPVVAEDRKPSFAVVPGPLYQPNLGWGLMVIPMAMYFVDPEDMVSPASATVGMGLYTTNESYVLALAQKLFLAEDTWRIVGAAGYASINDKFYGIGGTVDASTYVNMTMEAQIGFAEGLYKILPYVYAGPSLLYTRTRFRGQDGLASTVLQAAGLNADYEANLSPGVHAQWDTREDQVAPRAGSLVDLIVLASSQDLGSTNDYQQLKLDYSHYLQLDQAARQVLAWGLGLETTFGDVPFSAYADMGGRNDIRGYVANEFTDKNMLYAQAEYRWAAWGPLGVAGFFSVGKVFPTWDQFANAVWLPAGGVGFRYLVMPARRMNARLDFAWGRLGGNFYFSVGEAF
jgi:outer membrane protein assembly factor BamA